MSEQAPIRKSKKAPTLRPTRAQPAKAKHYCFTINNPSDDAHEILLAIECEYIVFQKEEGENKTPHMQGYIKFQYDKRFECVKRLFKPFNPHLEKTKGNPKQNIAYCTKEPRLAGPWEHGTVPLPQGARNDLKDVVDLINKGKTLKEVAEECGVAFIKYGKGIAEYKNTVAPILPRSVKPNVAVYYGPSGTGKSYRAEHEALALGSVYRLDFRSNNGSADWTGYDGQTSVIINDFYGRGIKWSDLLRLLDAYGNKVSALYRSTEFTSANIFITSNVHPETWYKNIPNHDWSPLQRRIDTIELMTEIKCPNLIKINSKRKNIVVEEGFSMQNFNVQEYDAKHNSPSTGISGMGKRSYSQASTIILCPDVTNGVQCGNAFGLCNEHFVGEIEPLVDGIDF